MFTARRVFALALLCLSFLAAAFYLSRAADAGKPQPPPDVDRPLLYLGVESYKNTFVNAVTVSDVANTSQTVLKGDTTLWFTGRLRWSPDGQFIGGYQRGFGYDEVFGGTNVGIMVMAADGADEAPLVTSHQFHLWNLSRPGVLDSYYEHGYSRPCWLGSDAMIFAAAARYDATVQSIKGRRLFVADFDGNIWPLTETADFRGTTFASINPTVSAHGDPHWSAALDKVVFVAGVSDGANELYAVNPDGTGVVQITDFGNTTHFSSPIWSPAGDRVLVGAQDLNSGAKGLLVLDLDLAQPNPGTGTGGRVTYVDLFKGDYGDGYDFGWSPDGREVIFRRSVSVPGDKKNTGGWFIGLVAADVETGAERVLHRGECHYPDWRPAP